MLITGLIIGAVLGLVLQRGRFCITGAFRDLWVSHSSRWFTAFLLAITIQALGVSLLTFLGVIAPEAPKLSVIATVLGSFLFGVGIVLAGGCATGTYYRAGEGLVGSWFALVAYALFAAAAKTGFLSPATARVKGLWTTGMTTIPATIGLPNWVGVAALCIVSAFAVHRQIRRESARRPAVQLPAQRTGLNHLLFEYAWNPLATGAIVGVIAIIAWPLSWASGRPDGLGITTPSANLVSVLVTGDWSRLRPAGRGNHARLVCGGQSLWRVPRAGALGLGDPTRHRRRRPHGRRSGVGGRLLDRQRLGPDLPVVLAGLDRTRLPDSRRRSGRLGDPHPTS